ncbi:GTPase domain-containing protein [Microbacterium aquimaris]|uniref:GTPase domain-containing protein n=1 Tax=Microbacterium aquimaris TaxID=459816 RepID=UPI002AD2DEB3|nr:GTPase domain-containing protein [Microbacterium aquimaris]MDZ8275720.1 GTPase domain-containing protein [Microbacterium aquimaris]
MLFGGCHVDAPSSIELEVDMPIPLLIPVAVGVSAAVTAGAGAVAAWKHGHAVKARRRVAVIGQSGVGKTTLVRYLVDGALPDSVQPTYVLAEGGEFALEAAPGMVDFVVEGDVPGEDVIGYPRWREAVEKADDVLYLFRADLIIDRDAVAVARMKSDLTMLQKWMAKKDKRRYILVGTSASTHADYSVEARDHFRSHVAAVPAIGVNRPGLNNAGLVIGDLSTEEAAKLLRGDIALRLVTSTFAHPKPTGQPKKQHEEPEEERHE